MAIHVSELNIDTYRGIKSLRLENFSSVNIITGDNNCGKTSVLELLRSLRNPSDFRVWRELIRRDSTNVMEGISYYEGFCDLFDINEEEMYIKYGVEYENEKHEIIISGEVSEDELLSTEYMKLQGFSIGGRRKEQDYTLNVKKIQMNIHLDGAKASESDVYEGQIRYVPKGASKNDRSNIIYISPSRHTTSYVYLNAVLDNSNMYEQMLDVLKEYDEDIISINYDNLNSGRPGRGVYKILSKSHQKALPLNMYGDGMKKAVLLMSAAIAAKDGILLIDEFETAIHTSAMDRTFAWVIDMCKRLNVQVFLTSHSKEAIDKLLKCSPENTSSMAVYTLSKRDNRTVVRRLDGKTAIEVQDNMGLELR